MTEQEAISAAMAFASDHAGIRAAPDMVRRRQSGWLVIYAATTTFPEVFASGGTVDGGELMLLVDDSTGEVSVWH